MTRLAINDSTLSMTDLIQSRLVEFVRLARDNDFQVGVAEEVDAQRVAASCGIMNPQRLRWGLRALLCSEQQNWERFDELFDAYWLPGNVKSHYQPMPGAAMQSELKGKTNAQNSAQSSIAAADTPGHGDGSDAADDGTREGASAGENLATMDFQQMTETSQMRAMERLVESLARFMRRRAIRRYRSGKQGRRIHLRATLRNSLRFGGTPLNLVFRARRKRQPRLILIVDVSRSMSMYSYLFLRFARGLLNVFSDASAFAYHTRLVPISEALRHSDLFRVRSSMAMISQGWSGGTRIGECLRSFNDDYARLLNSRSIVIVISDGLDTGEPEELTRQLGLIKARCRKLIWLNPLLGRQGYEPKTRSMLAALPLIDLFAPAHNLQSLKNLESELIAL